MAKIDKVKVVLVKAAWTGDRYLNIGDHHEVPFDEPLYPKHPDSPYAKHGHEDEVETDAPGQGPKSDVQREGNLTGMSRELVPLATEGQGPARGAQSDLV